MPSIADRALERIVEAGDQLRGRRLAAARLADERDASALGHVDRDAVDDRLVAVGEDDVVELQMARDAADLGGALAIGDVVLGVEHRRDLGHRGARGLHLPVELRELLQRLEDELEHPDAGDQRADLERAAVDHLRAGEEDDHGRDDAEELDRGEEERRQLLRVDVRDPVRLVQVAELALEGALATEGLDDRHARDRLGELGRDGGDPGAHVRERGVRRGLEPAGDDDARRQDDERHDAEAPVEQEQAADRGDERHRVDDERRQALVEDVREGVDVARQAGDDPAGLLLREVPERERREVLEEVAAQVEHHLLPDPGQHQPRRRAEDPRRQADARCRATTSSVSRLGSEALMPLSIASPTIVQPSTGAAAEIAAMSMTRPSRLRRPTV